MANPALSPDEQPAPAAVPSLDESLAQLEEALDLFVSQQTEVTAQKNEGVTEITPIPLTKLKEATVVKTPEPVPLEKEEAIIQALGDLKKKIVLPTEPVPQWNSNDMVAVPIEETELGKRRFPVFTDAQKRMMLIGVGLLSFLALIGFLIWQKQRMDEERLLQSKKQEDLYTRPLSTASGINPVLDLTATPNSELSITPASLNTNDALLADSVKQILTAYNPTAIGTRYKIDVKGGVVTLSGEAQTQMEKDGAENVIKPLQGVVKVVNSLIVSRGGLTTPTGTPLPNGSLGPVMYPKVNEAEAQKLDEAYLRELQESTRRAEEERKKITARNEQLRTQAAVAPEPPKPIDTDSERRKQSAAIVNQETNALRQQAEERLQREKDDYERRMAEQRKAEIERKQLEQSRQSTELRSGTVTWSGVVKGVEDIVITGGSASVRHVAGAGAQNARASFSAPFPNASIGVRLVASNGKSPIRIVQQPSAGNGFTTIVRVGDGDKADGKPHSFTLRWSLQ